MKRKGSRFIGKMSLERIIESIERDAFEKCMNPPEPLYDKRCSNCNRLLGRFRGEAEVKCPKCGTINRIEAK